MAVTDNHSNIQNELSDRKRCREEENPEALASPDSDSTKKKRKKKRKKKNKESDEQPQVQICPDPLLGTAIPIVQQNPKIETTTQNPDSTPDKKKLVQDAPQLQTYSPSITIGMEPDIRKEKGTQLDDANCNGDLCPNHEPAVPEKNKGAGPNEGTVENPVPDPTPSDHTPRKKKWKKKKKNVVEFQGAEPEPKESNNIEHPHQSAPVDPEVMNKMKEETEPKEASAEHSRVLPQPELTIQLDIAVPKDSELVKREEPTEINIEHPLECSKPEPAAPVDLATPMNPEKKKEVELSEAHEQHPQPGTCTKPDSPPPGDLTTPIDQSGGKRKRKRGRKRKMCLEEKVENQSDPPIPICPNPESLTDKTIPVDPEILIDTEQKIEKKKGKNVLDGVEPNEPVMEQAENPIQTPACLIAAPPIDPTILMNPCPAIPISPAISTDPEQKMSKKKRKKKRKSALKSEGAEPIEHNGKPADAPDQKFKYPVAAPSIDLVIPIGQASPVDTTTPSYQGQKLTKKKRKKKSGSAIASEGAEPNEHYAKPSETPVQGSIYHIAAPSTETSIPTGPAHPADTAIPIGQGQEMTKKKRKKNRWGALTSTGAEPSEHDGRPPETPVQSSIYPTSAPAVSSIVPTSQAPPTDPVTPIDSEQMMTKKMRKKKRKSELKNKELESKKHNADATTETPVQRTKEPSVAKVSSEWAGENSMSKCNAEPAATTRVLQSANLIVSPKDKSSLRCHACRHLGHDIAHCQKLRHLSIDEEVCFFCREIGHSLGKCSVSQAGGGRFAKCLFCYGHGHFSFNCPQNGQGIVPKVCNQWPYEKTRKRRKV